MSRFTVDASVAVKWFLPEPGTEAALGLRSAKALFAPELLLAEAANVLWKHVTAGRLDEGKAHFILSSLLSSPVEFLPGRQLVRGALTLSCRLGVSVYDAHYLAAAAASRSPLVTADRKLRHCLDRHSEFEVRIMMLDELSGEAE